VLDDTLEGRRHAVTDGARRRRLLAQDCRHRLGARVAAEGAPARQHLVEHGAEREDVGAMVGDAAPHLLRRHVADRPQNRAGLGAAFHRRRVRVAAVAQDGVLPRQAEVEDLQVPVAREEQVLGLQVAMHDALRVGRGQAFGDLPAVLRGLLGGERSGGEQLAQGLAVEQLHRRVVLPPGLTEVEDGQDVRVRERGHGLRFALEARERLRLAGKPRRQHLDRDVAVELLVARLPDLTHAPRAERGEHPIRSELSVRFEGHARRGLPCGS
jgi:hypothetical protein